MSAQKPIHRYAQRPSKKRALEGSIQWSFRIATYIVILAAGYIFGNIAYNGSKAVFTTQAPFINTDFLTQKPQTLHVYEPKEIYNELAQINRQQIALRKDRLALGSGEKEAAGEISAQLSTLQERYDLLDEQRKEGRLMYSDTEYRALENTPDTAEFAYKNYAYSGGGIGPAIIGSGSHGAAVVPAISGISSKGTVWVVPSANVMVTLS